MSLNPLIDKAVINSSEEADDLECSPRHLECSPRHLLNSDDIKRLQGNILNLEKAQRMAEFFSFLGDANRLRILSALAMKELCVHELAATVNMSESAVSHQLRNLRAIRLVSYRKQGRKVFYRLQDTHVFSLYQAVAEHLDEAED